MKIHISFAHNRFLKSQKECRDSALSVCGFDNSYSLGIKDIEESFLIKNEKIFSGDRGFGSWLWKSYFIKKYLEQINIGDTLVYTDSGMTFIKPIWDVHAKYIKTEDNGFMSTGECGVNSQFTKRDAFVLMDLDYNEYTNAGHKIASCIIVVKKENTLNFANEWLKYSENPNIITDLTNTQGKDNYADFIDHRHDQSIFSLLCKKYNVSHCEEGLCQFHQPNNYYLYHHRNNN